MLNHVRGSALLRVYIGDLTAPLSAAVTLRSFGYIAVSGIVIYISGSVHVISTGKPLQSAFAFSMRPGKRNKLS